MRRRISEVWRDFSWERDVFLPTEEWSTIIEIRHMPVIMNVTAFVVGVAFTYGQVVNPLGLDWLRWALAIFLDAILLYIIFTPKHDLAHSARWSLISLFNLFWLLCAVDFIVNPADRWYTPFVIIWMPLLFMGNALFIRTKAAFLINSLCIVVAIVNCVQFLNGLMVRNGEFRIDIIVAVCAIMIAFACLFVLHLTMSVKEANAAQLAEARHEIAQMALSQEMEEERRRFQSDLARMNRVHMVETMATTISHEISQPINSTSICMSAARRWLSSPEPNISEALTAVSQGTRQIERARDIVLSIKSMTAKVPERSERVGLAGCVRDVLQLSRRELRRQRVKVAFDHGEQDDDIFVVAIRSEVQQILVNLIMNSIEAFPADQEDRRIAIAIEGSSSGSVDCRVADNGPGLPIGMKEELITHFFTTKDYGTGLGLPICIRLAEKFGGQLEIDNAPGGGALAILRLPLHECQVI